MFHKYKIRCQWKNKRSQVILKLLFILFISTMNNELSNRSIGQGSSKLLKCKSEETLRTHKNITNDMPYSSRFPTQISNLNEFIREDIPQKFRPKITSRIQGHKKTIHRVKSEEKLLSNLAANQFESLIEIYKSQNDNLQRQNKFLVKELRKNQKNVDSLWVYISQLRKEVKALENKNMFQNYYTNNQATGQQNSPIYSPVFSKNTAQENPISQKKSSRLKGKKNDETDRANMDTFYYSGILITEENDDEDDYNEDLLAIESKHPVQELEQLSQKFNILMDQCSKETNKAARDEIRRKLATLAQKMKKCRKGQSKAAF